MKFRKNDTKQGHPLPHRCAYNSNYESFTLWKKFLNEKILRNHLQESPSSHPGMSPLFVFPIGSSICYKAFSRHVRSFRSYFYNIGTSF